jgi:hypothetical protein
MLRDKFDRSGVLDLEGHDPSQAVTALTGLPLEVTKAGLSDLLKSGTFKLTSSSLVWPRYYEAQNCKRSDRLRQQESRKNRSEQAKSEIGKNVTPVTKRHKQSQNVTLGLGLTEAEAEAEKDTVTGVTAPTKPPKRARAHKAPETTVDTWEGPTPKHLELAKSLGANLKTCEESMRDWAEARGIRRASWDAQFTNCLKAGGYGHPMNGGPQLPPPARPPSHEIFKPPPPVSREDRAKVDALIRSTAKNLGRHEL